MTGPSPLEDPATAAFAWARFRRLMMFMAGVTLLVVAVSFVAIYREFGWLSPHIYIAVGLGVGLSMLLTCGLMGLVFLSSGTGHDEAVDRRIGDLD